MFTAIIDAGPMQGIQILNAEQAKLTLKAESRAAEFKFELPPARILLVDDADENRRLIRLILRQVGIEVETAVNGQIAIDMVTTEDFELVLMDMQMPVMDGYAATSKLREMGYTLPIIALTANAMKGDEDRCRAAGCSGFLSKPINMDQLIQTLAESLQGGACKLPQASKPLKSMTLSQPLEEKRAPLTGMSVEDREEWGLPTEDDEYRLIVQDFVESLHEKLPTMRDLLEAQEFHQLARVAHALKGTGGTLGFDEFTEPAERLQLMAEQEQAVESAAAIDEIAELIDAIVLPGAACADALDETLQEVNSHISETTPAAVRAPHSVPLESAESADIDNFANVREF